MDKQLLTHLQNLVRAEAVRLEAIVPKCASCKHYEGVHCMEFNAVPPPDVQAIGCEAWQWDSVPF